MSLRGRYVIAKVLAVSTLAVSVLASASDEVQLGPLSRVGAFNHAVSYIWEFVPSEISFNAHPWGVPVSESWMYARVFTASGKQYVLMRYVGDLKSTGMTLTTDGKADPRMPLINVDVVRKVDMNDGLVFFNAAPGSAGDGKAFDLRLSPTAVHWTEIGVADLHGTGSPLGHIGSGAFMPFVKKDGSTDIEIYTGQYQPVTGTVFGEPVEGMFGFDQSIGKEKFHDTSLAHNEAVWIKWANVFKGGSIEMAECFYEPNGMQGCSVSDGKVIAHSDYSHMKLTFVQGEVTKGIWTIGHDSWEMIPDNTGNTLAVTGASEGVTSIVRRWGGVHRIGDKRRIVNQFSVFEYNPGLILASQIKSGNPKIN